MRLDIRYRMVFNYDVPVREAHNELRVRPQDIPGQRVLAHRITSDPPARILSFTDYWGTTVDHLGVVFEHNQFEVVAEAAVETRRRATPTNGPLQGLENQAFRLNNAELLAPSPHVQWNDEIADIARATLGEADDVVSLVHANVAATRGLINYERNSTRIGIPLTELVAGGAGVCQDYAHLTIALLRVVGVPARYVSGYLFAVDETRTDDSAEIVAVQTHAWVQALLPNNRWLDVDPTNDQPVGERHVVIGYGRDYDDVAPVRGVYAGDGVPNVDANVEIRRMEPVERTMTARPRRRQRSGVYQSGSLRSEPEQQQQQ